MDIVDVLVVLYRSSVTDESRLGIQKGICWRDGRVKHMAFGTKETMKRVSKIACSVCGKVDCSPAPSLVTMARQAGSKLRAASDDALGPGYASAMLPCCLPLVDVVFRSFS